MMDKEVLEVALKRFARESKIQRVLEVEAIPALPKGENYTSEILRLCVNVVLGNGRLAKKSFIMKKIHTENLSGEVLQDYSVTKAEAEIYLVIHKEMSYLMQEFQDTDETLWCSLIHYDSKSFYLIFEDLRTIGYKVTPRQQGLDLEHSLLALRGLARYHGMAKVLEERGVINKKNYELNHLLQNRHHLRILMYSALHAFAKAIKASWGSEWTEISDAILNMSFDPFADKITSLVEPLEGEFTCLNHGDCWSNNMMFKYDWRNRPIAVKLIDYQLPYYNTPCFDMNNLIYLSVQPHVRRQNYHLLLQTYHDCLVSTLERFGFSGTKPTLKEIVATMERLDFYGMIFFIFGHPVVSCTSTNAMDIEKLLATDGESGFETEIINEPGMKDKMKDDLIDFAKKYLPFR